MPIYEYKCSQCGKVIEKIQPMGKDAPICCGVGMDKLPTYPAMVKFDGINPSRRKFVKGTSPYTKTTQEWTPENNAKFR